MTVVMISVQQFDCCAPWFVSVQLAVVCYTVRILCLLYKAVCVIVVGVRYYEGYACFCRNTFDSKGNLVKEDRKFMRL